MESMPQGLGAKSGILIVLSQYTSITLSFQIGFNGGWSSMSLYTEKGLMGARVMKHGTFWDSVMGTLLGARGQGVHSWGYYWGPAAKEWGSIHGDVIGGQGPKSGSPFMGILLGARGQRLGVHSWGYYWGPGAKEWESIHGDTILLLLLLVCTPRSLGRLITITLGRWR